MAERPSAPEIMDACIDRRLEGVHTACPGTILTFSSSTQTAAVRTRLPEAELLENVPVCIPGDWESGDPVLLVFCEREFDADLEDAGEERRHGVGAAIAVPLIARAGDTTDFVALAGLVEAQFVALADAIQNAAVVAGDGGATFKTNLLLNLASWPASVAATKMKAR
jgi:hypothetical protein